jgi:hypothetical protein
MEKFSQSLSVPTLLMNRLYTKAAFFIVAGLILILTRSASGAPTTLDLNEAFGVPIFADEFLWDDNAQDVAARLEWPEESRTSIDSSFRKYPDASELLLGCRPYSLALYAEEEKPARLSIIFANKGDSVDSNQSSTRARNTQILDYKRSIQNDKKKLTEMLSKLFGEPIADRFGQGRETRESVKRWDWNGHAFLLASPRDEYVALRVMTTESADAGGKSRIPDSVIREAVANRMEKRANGDVVLKDMPMVNQGPKGYCVPATWERVMRYMGVPADMYTLAMAGGTQAGGGSSIDAISAGASQSVIQAGRRIESPAMKIDAVSISRFIDRGLPIMWAMFSSEDFNNAVNSRIQARKSMTDVTEWKKVLAAARKEVRKFRPQRNSAHVCMIIGYNKQTGEIAISDSWGAAFAERWITPEEAAAASQTSTHTVINF